MTTSPPARRFDVVVAATQRGGIGRDNDLPWSRLLSGDLRRFRHLTSTVTRPAPTSEECGTPAPPLRNAVVMGRRTWESIPERLRPLKNRLNVIVTSAQAARIKEESGGSPSVLVASSLPHALSLLSSAPYAESTAAVFVIGGASLIREALASPLLQTVHLTQVLKDFDCDTFIPPIAAVPGLTLGQVDAVTVEHDIPYQFLTYSSAAPPPLPSAALPGASSPSPNPGEQQYLDLVRRVLDSGARKGDRTGTGTLSLFGAQLRFDLSASFPLLTTKRVFWRGVVEELLWLLRGCTDSKALAARGVHIWDDNGSRAFLDRLGFTEREEGDLGPVYGHQFRHFGAKYIDCHTDYRGQGVDQLAGIVRTLTTNPDDRRILMSAWNPVDLPLMALPPCHVLSQFYVAHGRLSCHLYQRSCDLGLGVPFNVASYSLLTVMLAHVCGLQRGEFVHTLGDAHVYLSHVDALEEQLTRTPRPFPQVSIARSVGDIDGFAFEDFVLEGYNPHPALAMKMAV